MKSSTSPASLTRFLETKYHITKDVLIFYGASAVVYEPAVLLAKERRDSIPANADTQTLPHQHVLFPSCNPQRALMILSRCPDLKTLAAPAELLNFIFSSSVSWGAHGKPKWLKENQSEQEGLAVMVIPSEGMKGVKTTLDSSYAWRAVKRLSVLVSLKELDGRDRLPFQDLTNLTHLAIEGTPIWLSTNIRKAENHCPKLKMIVSLLPPHLIASQLVKRPCSLSSREFELWHTAALRHCFRNGDHLEPRRKNLQLDYAIASFAFGRSFKHIADDWKKVLESKGNMEGNEKPDIWEQALDCTRILMALSSKGLGTPWTNSDLWVNSTAPPGGNDPAIPVQTGSAAACTDVPSSPHLTDRQGFISSKSPLSSVLSATFDGYIPYCRNIRKWHRESDCG